MIFWFNKQKIMKRKFIPCTDAYYQRKLFLLNMMSAARESYRE